MWTTAARGPPRRRALFRPGGIGISARIASTRSGVRPQWADEVQERRRRTGRRSTNLRLAQARRALGDHVEDRLDVVGDRR